MRSTLVNLSQSPAPLNLAGAGGFCLTASAGDPTAPFPVAVLLVDDHGEPVQLLVRAGKFYKMAGAQKAGASAMAPSGAGNVYQLDLADPGEAIL